MEDNSNNYKEEVIVRLNKRRKKKDFLKELAGPDCAGSVTAACERIAVVRSTVYEWRHRDAIFEVAWDDAVVTGQKHLIRLAESSLVALLKQHHPTITIFTLKNKDRDNWRDSEDLSRPIDSSNVNEYIKQCEREGLDPATGLRKKDDASSSI